MRDRPVPVTVLVTGLIFCGLLLPCPVAAQNAGKVENLEVENLEVEKLRETVEKLERTVMELKDRILALEKERAGSSTSAPEPAPKAPALPADSLIRDANTVGDQQSAAPRPDNVPLDPALAGFIAIPGTQSMIKLGGYARVDAIRDFGNAGNPNWFVPASIPVETDPASSESSRFALHAKATRMSLEFRRPLATSDRLRIYYENDFFGDSSSPGMSFRVRHYYGQAWNILAGQTFSAFMNIDSWPDTVDYEVTNALANKRQPQLRYTQPLSRQGERRQSVFFSLEQPGSEVDVKAAGLPADTKTLQRMPDYVVGYRFEKKGLHVQLSALGRSIGIESPAGGDRSVFGWGLNLSGSAEILDRDKLSFQLLYGEGVARYLNDLGGQNLDAGLDASGNLEAIPVFGPVLGYTHNWSGMWRSTASYGYIKVDPVASLAASAIRTTLYASLNLIFQPTKAFRLGLEYLYGRRENQGGATGDASRLNFVVKYDLVK